MKVAMALERRNLFKKEYTDKNPVIREVIGRSRNLIAPTGTHISGSEVGVHVRIVACQGHPLSTRGGYKNFEVY